MEGNIGDPHEHISFPISTMCRVILSSWAQSKALRNASKYNLNEKKRIETHQDMGGNVPVPPSSHTSRPSRVRAGGRSPPFQALLSLFFSESASGLGKQ